MNKVLVKLYVPTIGQEYDIWIPVNRRIHNAIRLIVKALDELVEGGFKPNRIPELYDKKTALPYNINLSIRQTNIRNGSELILI